MSTVDAATTRTPVTRPALGVLIALMLALDAAVHLHLAHGYQQASPSGVGAGTLFRLEAAVAIAAALLVLVRADRPAYLVAFLVSASALAAVLLYRYVNVPAIGPLPSMYEPVWFLEKSLSALAEGLAAILAAAVLLLAGHNKTENRRRGRRITRGQGR